jgi:hypothetical protein
MLRWDKVSQHRRKHLIECLRNVAFAYEEHEAKFTEVALVKELGHILADEEGLTGELLPEEVMSFKAAKKPFEVKKANVKNIIDTFILLSNSDNLMKQIADAKLDSLIGVIDVKG